MRRQIGWLVFATTTMVVACFVVPLCLLVRTMAEDRGRAAVDQEARGIATLVAGLYDSPQLVDLVAGLDQRAEPDTMVVFERGRLLGGGQLPPGDPLRSVKTNQGTSVRDDAGYRVTLPVTVGDGSTALVVTSLRDDELSHGVASAWAAIIAVGLALTALALVLASALARRISRPVLEVAAVAHQVSAGDLSARAVPSGPGETQELARALNGLAERTTELLAAERAAVGDLSHRLRTPVTALRLDAEAVRDPAMSERLGVHIEVLQRTIDAIVREARRPVATDLSARCDAASVVADRVTFWSALAEDQGREVGGEIAAGPLVVPLSDSDLRALVDVLIDNVFAHTPEAVAFAVDLTSGPLPSGQPGVQLRVRDFAPAVGSAAGSAEPDSPAATGERVGRSGLGLDLARRTATGVGGDLHTAHVDPGFEVTLSLPLKATP